MPLRKHDNARNLPAAIDCPLPTRKAQKSSFLLIGSTTTGQDRDRPTNGSDGGALRLHHLTLIVGRIRFAEQMIPELNIHTYIFA